MLNDASGFRRIYLATGYTDLRRGMEGLASIIKFNFQLDPYQKDILFLFCGRRTDRIKGLVWEGDGFLLLYKRLELGAFNWPRTKEEALEITPEQYQYLMQGLEVVARHPIQEVRPGKNAKETIAYEAVSRIAAIYHLDNQMEGQPAKARKMYRQTNIRPLVEAFFAWAKEIQSKNQLSRGKTLDGINYCINQEASLKAFLEDGDIPMDNNATESALRSF